ncbi:methyltransferase domain-containing protein [Leucobacter sp. CSA1]|uniref:Methyltransferase domain-containing protein n=1 Tax=Leucobacter chromiisoli TaxID=2796471 RepID=A0A934Q8Y6_9MICO|nr:methyltransferase domain-containing protein [Leucobacter chromiisoli]MBK0419933.1 methyltransferase domain-containing protein [Leucobacter chromiisoli]
MTLSSRDEHLAELMDDPECDPVRLRRTLQRFGAVNRLVSGWDGVYRSTLRPALASVEGRVRLLDIGCGAGDVLRRLVRLARRDGFAVEGVGIDPDPRALAVAEEASAAGGVTYRKAYAHELVAAGERFDVVVSNHLLHHLGSSELDGLLADSEALAARLCVHSDIERSAVAYAAFAVGITPLAPGSFLRTDGLRSIRRSYTREELAARLPSGWSTPSAPRFRVLAVHRSEGRGAPRTGREGG